MQQLQARRSNGTIHQRREQLRWSENDFRILSIDGGGIKGILPAAILAECERRFLKGGSSADYFDMLGGTSTGGIVALGLGVGMRADEILQIYLEHGAAIFPRGWTPPTSLGRAMRNTYQFFRDLALYKYDSKPLEYALRSAFGNRLYGECKSRITIPTFDGFNEVTVLKTPHHPDFKLDWQEEMVTVALATSAAPTFFSVYRDGTRHFADGGVWANNPVMVSLVDAMTCFDIDRHSVDILSIGCGETDLKMSNGQIKWGGIWHWKMIVETAMHLQSQNALGQSGLLIGRDRLLRLSPAPSIQPIALDDFERAQAELPRQAKRLVEDNSARLEMLFDSPRPEVEFYHGPRSDGLRDF